jgi:tRNA-intron lyase
MVVKLFALPPRLPKEEEKVDQEDHKEGQKYPFLTSFGPSGEPLQAFVFSPEDISHLRRVHRIVGSLVGAVKNTLLALPFSSLSLTLFLYVGLSPGSKTDKKSAVGGPNQNSIHGPPLLLRAEELACLLLPHPRSLLPHEQTIDQGSSSGKAGAGVTTAGAIPGALQAQCDCCELRWRGERGASAGETADGRAGPNRWGAPVVSQESYDKLRADEVAAQRGDILQEKMAVVDFHLAKQGLDPEALASKRRRILEQKEHDVVGVESLPIDARCTWRTTPDAPVASADIPALLGPTRSQRFRNRVFADLWARGYFLTDGSKFGGDFLAYLGDPLQYHARFIVKVHSAETQFRPLPHLVGIGRVAVAVKKSVVLALVDDDDAAAVQYLTMDWQVRTSPTLFCCVVFRRNVGLTCVFALGR